MEILATDMKVVITRGKYKGYVCEVSQWCNDWFTLDPRDNKKLLEKQQMDIMRKPFSPSSLAFTYADIREIMAHKNNGMLLAWYQVTMLLRQSYVANNGTSYGWTFRRRKYGK